MSFSNFILGVSCPNGHSPNPAVSDVNFSIFNVETLPEIVKNT
jgi:hypothetical protein